MKNVAMQNIATYDTFRVGVQDRMGHSDGGTTYDTRPVLNVTQPGLGSYISIDFCSCFPPFFMVHNPLPTPTQTFFRA